MPSTPRQPSDRKAKAKATSKKYGAGWGTNLVDLPLPSGELCQVKRPGVQGLIKAGVLHSLDSLTSIVQMETIPTAQGLPIEDIKAIIEDSDKFDRMMSMVDKIVVFVVTQPKVLPVLIPDLDENNNQKTDDNGEPAFRDITDDERDPDAVYVDYIDVMDKMFIMNFAVGGTRDFEQFRAETEAAVGGVLPS